MKLKILALALAAALVSTIAVAAPVALFDQAHGQRFLIDKSGELSLGGLAQAFRAAGFEVKPTSEPFTPESLKGVAVVVSSGSLAPFKATEIDALKKFVAEGGKLSVMMHISPTYEALLIPFGIAGSPGVVHETENVEQINSLDFTAKDLAKHPLFEGVEGVKFYGSWAVAGVAGKTEALAKTSKNAWMDLNRNKVRDEKYEPLIAFGLIVAAEIEKGRVIAFADDALFQDKFLTGDNARLAANLAKWLKPAN